MGLMGMRRFAQGDSLFNGELSLDQSRFYMAFSHFGSNSLQQPKRALGRHTVSSMTETKGSLGGHWEFKKL